jgi:uridine kinase
MVIGICGGTGSGKTTVAHKIVSAVGAEKVVYLQQDAYYRDLGDMPLEVKNQLNFDHPDAFDNDLLINHLRTLKAGESIDQPVYDFTTHSRAAAKRHVKPRPVIIIEGILIFVSAELRSLMDMKVFVDTAADICFIRRLQRDLEERGRTAKSVIDQYQTTVRPMHLQFVEPSKRYADIIIPEGGSNQVGIDLITEKIKAILLKSN